MTRWRPPTLDVNPQLDNGGGAHECEALLANVQGREPIDESDITDAMISWNKQRKMRSSILG